MYDVFNIDAYFSIGVASVFLIICFVLFCFVEDIGKHKQ